jgi:hypothetical protein
MLLSELTPGAAKSLTCPEDVLPTGPVLTVDYLASAWFRTLSALQAKPRCPLDGPAFWVFTVSSGSLCLGLVLLLAMCVRRCELLPTPLRDAY